MQVNIYLHYWIHRYQLVIYVVVSSVLTSQNAPVPAPSYWTVSALQCHTPTGLVKRLRYVNMRFCALLGGQHMSHRFASARPSPVDGKSIT